MGVIENTNLNSPTSTSQQTSSATSSPFLAACYGQAHERVPVWFMRQAGRSLPEYRMMRGTDSILTAIADADLATEITLQPVRRYGVDAAILFSDIMVPVYAVGFGVDIQAGVGPVIAQPFSDASDLERLRPLEPEEDIAYVLEAVKNLQAELVVPLIGFAGAPFTVASYLIEGGPTKTFQKTKSLMFANPELWTALMDRLCDITETFLKAQVEAGASALQLFDSWAGTLSPAAYEQLVFPYTKRIIASTDNLGVPRICHGVGTGELLALFAQTGAEVVGVDWRVRLDEARLRTGGKVSLQGNLDPAVCLAPWPVVAEQTRKVLAENGSNPGYIFNLGHGVLPPTDPAILKQIVDLVHAEGHCDAN